MSVPKPIEQVIVLDAYSLDRAPHLARAQVEIAANRFCDNLFDRPALNLGAGTNCVLTAAR